MNSTFPSTLLIVLLCTIACGQAMEEHTSTTRPRDNKIAPARLAGRPDESVHQIPSNVDKPEVMQQPLEEEKFGTSIWAKQFGSPDMEMGVAVAVDGQDNIYVAGNFNKTFDIGTNTKLLSTGLEDIFLMKLNPGGTPIWAKSFGGTSHDYADDLTVDTAGNVYLSGSFLEKINLGGKTFSCKGVHDIFVAGFTGTGEHLWSRSLGDREDQISMRLEADTKGGLFVSGWFRGVVKPARKRHRSYPYKATFVARLDHKGKGIWSDGFGHVFDYAAPGLAALEDGGLILSGGSDPTIEFTGRKMKRIDRMGDLGLVLARYGPNGKLLWRKRFPGGNENLTTRTAIAPGGDILVAGSFNGDLDFGNGELKANGFQDTFLARFDSEGNPIWGQSFSGSRIQALSGLSVKKDGTILVTGQFEDGPILIDGEPLSGGGFIDVFLAAFDPRGNSLWSRSYGDKSIQWPGDMTLDSKDNAIVVGAFNGTIAFQESQLISAGQHDIFIMKIDPSSM